MQNKPYRVFLPSSNPKISESRISVLVKPFKTYGDQTGEQLIRQYGRRQLPPIEEHEPVKSSGELVSDTTLFIPCGVLPVNVVINNRAYNSRQLFNLLEEIFNRKILCRNRNKALRNWRNVSVKLPLLESNNPLDPLQILVKEKTYSLTPIK